MSVVAAIFPGQGAQEPGMGLPWHHSPQWDVVDQAETVLGRSLHRSLLDLDADPELPGDPQLAVLLTSVMAWHALTAEAPETARMPWVVTGHSLGRISAMVAAGVISLADAVRIVELRGTLTAWCAGRTPGGMLAVLRTERVVVERACAETGCWIANENAPGQLVVAGADDPLDRMQRRLVELGGRKMIRLNIPGAFHSPLMRPAADRFHTALSSIDYAAPAHPLVLDTDAMPVPPRHDWATGLAEHLVSGVRWVEVQHRLRGMGAEQWVEFGHGSTLTSLARRTFGDAEPALHRLAGPDDAAACAASLGSLITG